MLRCWKPTSPAMVSPNVTMTSKIRGVKDTSLTRTFGTCVNDDSFRERIIALNNEKSVGGQRLFTRITSRLRVFSLHHDSQQRNLGS